MDHHLSGHGHEGEIPIPITSTYVVHHHHTNNINNNLSPTSNNNTEDNKKVLVLSASSTSKAVRYRECLKNHAASMGGTATDGCGEFMPSGEEGSLEALKCSACGCHRNFHRKEEEGELLPSCYYKPSSRNAAVASFHGYMPRQQQQPQPPALIMPLGAIHTSESDEIEDGYGRYGGGPPMLVKKRFRTKFTAEQKEKMLGFAERAGWKLQRQEEGAVQQFCQEIGVKRRVLKVWMHNNKHNLAKKSSATSTNNISTPPQIQ